MKFNVLQQEITKTDPKTDFRVLHPHGNERIQTDAHYLYNTIIFLFCQ